MITKPIISKISAQVMLELVEIKLGLLQVQDLEDARELARINNCRRELRDLISAFNGAASKKSIKPGFSRQSLEILIDLVEIKIGLLQQSHMDMTQELRLVLHCRREINQLMISLTSRRKKTSTYQENRPESY